MLPGAESASACPGPFLSPPARLWGGGQSRGEKRGWVLVLTSSMVHLATAEAEMPATPGRSLQCCSQHTDSERSGWADRADMKRDWCMASAASAAGGGRGQGRQADSEDEAGPQGPRVPLPLGRTAAPF